MNIQEATRGYEEWMRRCSTVVEADLQAKHAKMRRDVFLFLRGTYYRWAQTWPALCPDLQDAPRVLAVGDLHVGSFGTWRDGEGRLAWGVDDFDEAYPLPYANDLVRLATSLRLLHRAGVITLGLHEGCDAILDGYRRTLREGGKPIVLAEQEQHLETLGIEELKPPADFWRKLVALRAVRHGVPSPARRAMVAALPAPGTGYWITRRQAGLGSLGQQRFVAIVKWKGGYVAREAKALIPSASVWLRGQLRHGQSHYARAIHSAIRSADPYQYVSGTWLVRRLSPDANPVAVEDLPDDRDEAVLLQAMGIEAANVHLGQPRQAEVILRDLRQRKKGWLRTAAKTMATAVSRDWREFA